MAGGDYRGEGQTPSQAWRATPSRSDAVEHRSEVAPDLWYTAAASGWAVTLRYALLRALDRPVAIVLGVASGTGATANALRVLKTFARAEFRADGRPRRGIPTEVQQPTDRTCPRTSP